MRYILLKNKMVTTHCCAVAGSQGGVLTPCMAGGSRMAIDRPSHPYNAGTEHVGFSPTSQTLLAPSAKHLVT